MDPIILAILVAIVVAVFLVKGSKAGKPKTTGPTSGWLIGPNIDNENRSVNMPARPTLQGAGWFIELVTPASNVHAVLNYQPPPLVGATAVHMRYAVTGGGFVSSDGGDARVSLCIQRKGDDWTGEGKYQQYRLYSQSRPLLGAGDGHLVASVWTDVKGKVVSQAVVDAVLADLSNLAVTFGGDFAAHGVFATEPSRFTLLAIDVAR